MQSMAGLIYLAIRPGRVGAHVHMLNPFSLQHRIEATGTIGRAVSVIRRL